MILTCGSSPGITWGHFLQRGLASASATERGCGEAHLCQDPSSLPEAFGSEADPPTVLHNHGAVGTHLGAPALRPRALKGWTAPCWGGFHSDSQALLALALGFLVVETLPPAAQASGTNSSNWLGLSSDLFASLTFYQTIGPPKTVPCLGSGGFRGGLPSHP